MKRFLLWEWTSVDRYFFRKEKPMKKLLTILLVVSLSMACLFAATETINLFGMKITTSDDGVWPTAELSRIGYGRLPQPRGGSVEEFMLYEMDRGCWMVLGYTFPSNALNSSKDYAKQAYNSGYCYRSEDGGFKKVDMQYLTMEMEGVFMFTAMDSTGNPLVITTTTEDNEYAMAIMAGKALF